MDHEQPPPIVPNASPAKAPVPKLRLHVVSAALAMVAIASHAFAGYAKGMRAQNPWEGVGEGLGGGLVIILFAYLLA